MESIDQLTVQVLVDNVTDGLSTRPSYATPEIRVLRDAGMTELAGTSLSSAHHGLSLVITAQHAGTSRTLLFDGGPDPYAIARNGPRLAVDFSSIDAIVLSHGHWDHAGGLPEAVKRIYQGRGERPVPLHVHPGAVGVQRGQRLTDGPVLPYQFVPTRAEWEALGAAVRYSTHPESILDDRFTVSGEIPRTSFEPGFPGHVRQSPDGSWQDDPLIMDERWAAAHLKNKGLVVFTGCSHAGIVNVLQDVQYLFPEIPIYGVIGGLHLVGLHETLIPQTVEAMATYPLRVIGAGHCTGWRAVHRLVETFGEAVVNPLAVGMRLVLQA